MAQISGTTDVLDVVGVREDLEDVIWDLFPGDTWCLSNLDKVEAKQPFHEWLLDSLASAATNRQIEGDDAAYTTIAAATRVGNQCQISRKTFIISGTLEKAVKAGRKSEIARAGMKAMRELKRDAEVSLVTNQASSAGGSATARSCGSMESWIASTDNAGNGVRATTTASASTAAYSGGVTTPTDGTTTGALTETQLKAAIELAWQDGGDVTTVLMSSTQKKVADAFVGIATRFVDVDKTAQASIIGAANVYVTEFGKHMLVMHRYMRTSVVLCIDPSYWAVGMFRAPFMEELAKTGDAEKRQVLMEYTLVSRNANASAKVAACA